MNYNGTILEAKSNSARSSGTLDNEFHEIQFNWHFTASKKVLSEVRVSPLCNFFSPLRSFVAQRDESEIRGGIDVFDDNVVQLLRSFLCFLLPSHGLCAKIKLHDNGAAKLSFFFIFTFHRQSE